MKEKDKYIVVVKMPDDSQQEFICGDIHEVGSGFKGGIVTDCRKCTKKYSD